MTKPSAVDLRRLWALCRSFVEEQRISCKETIYQTDRVIENSYEFVDRVCAIVGFAARDDVDEGD